MKKTKLLMLSMLVSMAASAQTVSDGYYRIQNASTQRFVSASDNYGYYAGGTVVDVSSLKTKPADGIESDVASVIYIKAEGDGYNLYAQGYDTYPVFEKYLTIWDNGNDTYKAYIKKGNTVVYLFDVNGTCSTGNNGSLAASNWYIKPIDDANYFGVTPKIESNGEYYQSFFADFPFTVNSNSLKAYTVSDVNENKGTVTIAEVTGEVAGGTPVIFKSTSQYASDNRLNIAGEPVLTNITDPEGNNTQKSLGNSGSGIQGVYFCNPVEGVHFNAVKYDAATMRILGTDANGKVAFVKANVEYVPANTAYINVGENAPENFYLVTEDQAQQEPTGDVTGDLKIDGQDIVRLQKMVLGLVEPDLQRGDLNHDGRIDIADVRILANMALTASPRQEAE